MKNRRYLSSSVPLSTELGQTHSGHVELPSPLDARCCEVPSDDFQPRECVCSGWLGPFSCARTHFITVLSSCCCWFASYQRVKFTIPLTLASTWKHKRQIIYSELVTEQHQVDFLVDVSTSCIRLQADNRRSNAQAFAHEQPVTETQQVWLHKPHLEFQRYRDHWSFLLQKQKVSFAPLGQMSLCSWRWSCI